MNPWISLALTFFIFALLVAGGILAMALALWLAWKITGVIAGGRKR